MSSLASSMPTTVALACIRAYQAGVSPGLGPRCRYEPTCSAYAYTAIERFGVVRGTWLAARRLFRCRPGGSGGYDAVPESAATATDARQEGAAEPLGHGPHRAA